MNPRRLTPRQLGLMVLAVSATLLSAGCELITGLDGDERELERRERQWSQQALTDYDFVMRHSCFCGLGGVPILVEVRGGAVRSQTIVETGAEIPLSQWPLRRTVEDLFEVLHDAFDRDAHRIDASYDPSRGYPEEVFIDYSRNVADEEYGWTIVSLTPR